MDFRPEHYHRAALERIEQARILYVGGGNYALHSDLQETKLSMSGMTCYDYSRQVVS